jgi:outer membrane murein-binding lipoprotein Lpp
MRTRIVVGALVVLLPLAVGCADPEKDRKIAALEKQMAGLEQMVADLEQQAEKIKADAQQPPTGGNKCGAELAACRERLVQCEQDPFKGGKYFVAEEGAAPATGSAGPELKDPFDKARPKPAPAGEVVDPFKKGD